MFEVSEVANTEIDSLKVWCIQNKILYARKVLQAIGITSLDNINMFSENLLDGVKDLVDKEKEEITRCALKEIKERE